GALGPGCAFAPRCPLATGPCHDREPEVRAVDERLVACHHADDLSDPLREFV
ncbi:ABC transporter ATP-binding protein, partial [Streptomyces rochei]|nr:ABC transporter ATP-binding protein [Streptomyces rochei]